MAKVTVKGLSDIGTQLKNSVADLLANDDFMSRTIGMNASYDSLMFLIQMLGREPISLLGKDYTFIFDHVRRNYLQGTEVMATSYGGNGRMSCPKFTFYKERPTVRFADPYNDPMNLLDRWMPDVNFTNTMANDGTEGFYAESNDGMVNNKVILTQNANEGTYHGYVTSFGNLGVCDMVKKTNDNFKFGKYKTLIARFHTNSEDSKAQDDTTQTANTVKYGMSHGRNLLKLEPDEPNGYNNPYCRVWTYHHQYNKMTRAIRPFGLANSAEVLESLEDTGNGVGFRRMGDRENKFDGGSKRLDNYGVLNYSNNMVTIAPTAKIRDYFEHKENGDNSKTFSTKRCMFSIENLAWKDVKAKNDEYDPYGLSPEQRGPLGGRIMWFPPYDLQFSEDVSVDWNSNRFIGRGESVYTYTNTERRGNLSFTMIIDHPSILDYWTGLERNGMKNQGVPLLKGNTGGVDEKYNQEQTLLRFFAGCDVLTALPQEFRKRTRTPKEPPPPKPKQTNPPPPEVRKPKPKKICAILYYPNNYSGKDDRNGSIVNPIWYLMNGVGAQKHVNPTTKDAEDIPTTITLKPNSARVSVNGGYEVIQSDNSGVSLATEKLNPNHEVIKSTYADLQSKERKAQYLTDNEGNEYTVKYGDGQTYTLAKIIGSKALSLGNAYGSKLTAKSGYAWYHRRYYYRVDKAYENQVFTRPESYIDRNSFALNGDGFNIIREKYGNVASQFGVQEDSDEFEFISFTDLFVALEGDNTVVRPHSEDVVKRVREILLNNEVYSDVKITFNGHASRQGYKEYNDDLSKNRALTYRRWLQGFKLSSAVHFDGEPRIITQSKNDNVDVGGLDEQLVKLWRSAAIVIEYEESNVESAAFAESTDGDGQVVRTDIKNKETSKNNILAAYDKEIRENPVELKEQKRNPVFGEAYDRWIREEGKDEDKYFNSLSWDYDDKYLNQGLTVTSDTVRRYDNEGEFFETLDKKAPFLHHLIAEKIKYFDPAYHSISPEGFNARLTFLHQCTRQGSTLENNAFGASTAYNLAFGRPPVCVLRIGDFYYTKIVITSLSIQYETPQWDLNPEGIGVMPMFAKININFAFLGGSDLGGPIARLQNAVSFNYYANTSVYDDRAEMVEYDERGKGNEIKFKGFNYPSEFSSKGD